MPFSLTGLFSKGDRLQRCPDCDEPIASDAINIKEGFALCPKCGQLSRLSELDYSGRSVEEILSQPPWGCSIANEGQGVVVRVSWRSWAGFLFPAAFALFWNSIVSVFVLIAIAGLWINLVGPLPDWFPAPGQKGGKAEMNGEPMGLGMTLFLCAFLIPFVVVGVGTAAAALMGLVGHTEVVIDEQDSYVATGAGFLRWRRRFDPRQVRGVNYRSRRWGSEDGPSSEIELSADRTIRFGMMLPQDRMQWLKAMLKELLLANSTAGRVRDLPYLSWLTPRR